MVRVGVALGAVLRLRYGRWLGDGMEPLSVYQKIGDVRSLAPPQPVDDRTDVPVPHWIGDGYRFRR